MEADIRKKIQLVLVIAMAIAAIRVGWIFYERHEAAKEPVKQEAPPLNPDYYVTPKKIYPYDLKTARKELLQQPAWVKVGYYYPYYDHKAAGHQAELAHEAGKLLPLEKLDIKDVFLQASPRGGRQVMALFERDGKQFATAIGNEKNGDLKFYCNDMLFFEDPHQLYKQWPNETWEAIDRHEVKPGMSEMQVIFAIGVGLREPGGDDHDRTLLHPNGGKPLQIAYYDGKVASVKPEKNE